ncbi:helix-turn-helix domain-containing protein [Oceanimonas smirnovii]|uniref:Helix-turn-helix domain-containing protein n=1 Tax=Oceanimonas smirnovii TaxID=264574 RepID=A0ABW7P4D6_9GAMM
MSTALSHAALAEELAANPRFTRKEAAAYLGLAEKTLANWATTGKQKIKYHRCGRKTIYMKADLDAWLAANIATHAA